jgi:chaperonin GroEL
MLGTLKVTIDKDNTTIVSGAEADMIKNRVNQIKGQMEADYSDYDKEKLQELWQISWWCCCTLVLFPEEREKDRVDDALHATVLQLKKELLQEVVLFKS